jgi:hypothetical protein
MPTKSEIVEQILMLEPTRKGLSKKKKDELIIILNDLIAENGAGSSPQQNQQYLQIKLQKATDEIARLKRERHHELELKRHYQTLYYQQCQLNASQQRANQTSNNNNNINFICDKSKTICHNMLEIIEDFESKNQISGGANLKLSNELLKIHKNLNAIKTCTDNNNINILDFVDDENPFSDLE